ncbi:MAG: 5-oxoprolinase subunit PxpA [Microlunatus sp.]
MTRTIDLIADVGESFGSWTMGCDADILPWLTSANVACGFHAGDPLIMERTVRHCLDLGVRIGAHPGFRDLVGFGRRAIETSADEIRTDVLYQIGALGGFVRAAGGTLAHVTPHGRLGNLVVTDENYAVPVLDAIAAYDPNLIVVAQDGVITRLAAERGIPAARLGLVDRAYEDDGSLVSRRKPGAVLHDPQLIAERAVKMVLDGVVTSVNGIEVAAGCDTVLLHGDNAASVEAARMVRTALQEAGVILAPLGSTVAA